MNGILALGHFCETHGPCIILCTQTAKSPELAPHLLTVPVCDACRSISLDQAFSSYSNNTNYITTRVPIKQEVAFLLKQACVRSLSCEEETSKDGGTVYFGDNERGHVLSHTFLLQDSLARGFHRKFTLLMLMRDKIHLLNSWPFITKHMKELENYLHEKASNVNKAEQAHCPQRAFRQVQGGPGAVRSLAQLTGTPAVFGHIHLWFCWMLNAETVTERFQLNTSSSPKIITAKTANDLRQLIKLLHIDTFTTLANCIITGVNVKSACDDGKEIVDVFKMLLPPKFRNSINDLHSNEDCRVILSKERDNWKIQFNKEVPAKLPALISKVVRSLQDENLPDTTLEPHLEFLVTEWFNIAQSLVWAGGKLDQNLLQSLGVQSYDLPLVKYWMSLINK